MLKSVHAGLQIAKIRDQFAVRTLQKDGVDDVANHGDVVFVAKHQHEENVEFLDVVGSRIDDVELQDHHEEFSLSVGVEISKRARRNGSCVDAFAQNGDFLEERFGFGDDLLLRLGIRAEERIKKTVEMIFDGFSCFGETRFHVSVVEVDE